MRARRVLVGVAGLAGVFGVAAAFASGASLGSAIEVPGAAALNLKGWGEVRSVSCPGAGNCAAGGYYTDGSNKQQAFVVSERNGAWGKARRVPGTAALNTGVTNSLLCETGGNCLASVVSVSCSGAGNCAAGGYYTDGSNNAQAFVVKETNGAWGTAIEVPGTAALNDGNAQVNAISCGGAGSCAAGGYYTDSSNKQQAFVEGETNGAWGTAIKVPGTAILNTGGNATVFSVSCASAGNCAVGGYYTDSSNKQQAFVVDEKNAVWGKAREVPGTATLNAGGNARATSVSCGRAGYCAAGGYYKDGSNKQQAFVADEKNGTWGTAKKVPGTAALNTGGEYAGVWSISCASAGNCSAGGSYWVHTEHAFVVSEKSGVWSKAIEVPGAAALKAATDVTSVSCASAGNCEAGLFSVQGSPYLAFVASEKNGVWGKVIRLPGMAALLGTGADSFVDSVSCAQTGRCAAGGFYQNGPNGSGGLVEPFVTSP